jgi:hypothetical protein
LTLYFTRSQDIWVSTRDDRSSAWKSPSTVDELNTGDVESNASVSYGDRGLFFARGTSVATRDIYEASRPGTTGTWDTIVARTELNTADLDAGSTVAIDGRLVVFFTARPGDAGGSDLYTATRSGPMAAFTNIVPLSELNTAGDEEDPWLSEDGHYLVFSRDGDLYEVSR